MVAIFSDRCVISLFMFIVLYRLLRMKLMPVNGHPGKLAELLFIENGAAVVTCMRLLLLLRCTPLNCPHKHGRRSTGADAVWGDRDAGGAVNDGV